MFDFLGFAETHPAWVTAIAVGAVALGWLAGRELRDLWRGAITTKASVLVQEEAIRTALEFLSSLSEMVVELQERANTHYADVQRLADDEHWKNCQVDKCPNLPNILSSCKQTNDTLIEIATQLRQLSIEMIATLRSFRTGSEYRSFDDVS